MSLYPILNPTQTSISLKALGDEHKLQIFITLGERLVDLLIPGHSLNGYWQIVTQAVMDQLWKFKSIYELLIEEVCHRHLCTKGCLFSSKLQCKTNMCECMEMSFCCFFQCMLCIQRSFPGQNSGKIENAKFKFNFFVILVYIFCCVENKEFLIPAIQI